MEEAIIYSTYKLSNQEISLILEKIPSLNKFRIINKTDKTLISGIIIKFSDKIIDLSIRNKLKLIFKKIYEQI